MTTGLVVASPLACAYQAYERVQDKGEGMATSGGTLGWAILGTGAVARKFVLDLAAQGQDALAVTVASRNFQNAQSFASGLPVARVALGYAEAVADEDVGAVYIATPPDVHEEHAMLAIAAGKAVLIEKPFAVDAAAARRIADAARAAGVFCMEAMWTRFLPLLGEISARLGELGSLRGFEGRFCAANAPASESSLFRAQGGGALMHRGIYPLFLARLFLGDVADMSTFARLGDAGADEDVCLTLRHESGALSQIRASLRSVGPEGGVIYGTKGTLFINGPLYRPTSAHIQPVTPSPAGTGHRDARRLEAFRESALGWAMSGRLSALKTRVKRQRISAELRGNGYHYQADRVRACLAEGLTECSEMSLADSIRVMDLIDEAKAQWSGSK